MTISYNWLCEYLPSGKEDPSLQPAPEQLSKILTSIGLEVESLTKYESVKGGLQGLLIGEVMTCEKHPNADKLKLTKVNVGAAAWLQIVCGAPNVAAGQKVVVAPVNTTIYPTGGEPVLISKAKIRGIESEGMICSEDEIGLGNSHAGILVLPAEWIVGRAVADYFKPYTDHIFEIGLTPNHMDAMSHIGVARDVCAYLSHHNNKTYHARLPALDGFATENHSLPIDVQILNKKDCGRYSGLSIKGISIQPSPLWMQEKLKAIGVRPINNIVDISNYVLHEWGQPLHAFDADRIRGGKIIVGNLPGGTKFITLDEKERTLSADDLMICDAEGGICMAGVFGGLHSGISDDTKNIFLESAWFNPSAIRKTSFRHGLRTDAATHFEKGMDISNTVTALKRTALLIKALAGGEIASDIVDVYPDPKPKTEILLKNSYLKKLSGKEYTPEVVKNILKALEFDIPDESKEAIRVAVPYHKPDVVLPADLVEEIMRIDGYDNIIIPASITISPSIETDHDRSAYRQKISDYLVGSGFHEILTNSITNSAYFSEEELKAIVKMINNLSAELNVMRPSLLETGLEAIAYNINRKNADLRCFEFGKLYSTSGVGKYREENHLALYVTGSLSGSSWKTKPVPSDFFYLKGICLGILDLLGVGTYEIITLHDKKLQAGAEVRVNGSSLVKAGMVQASLLRGFDIRQPVFFADLHWDNLLQAISRNTIEFRELPRQLPVYRDLAMIVQRSLRYGEVERTVRQIGLNKLQKVQLFDIFESEKLGKDKKSLALSFTFLDPEKTLTDKEIDSMMEKIMTAFEKELGAEIRK